MRRAVGCAGTCNVRRRCRDHRPNRNGSPRLSVALLRNESGPFGPFSTRRARA
jgi:hypothetical protein